MSPVLDYESHLNVLELSVTELLLHHVVISVVESDVDSKGRALREHYRGFAIKRDIELRGVQGHCELVIEELTQWNY